MAKSTDAVPEFGYSSTVRKSLLVDGSGNAITSANPLPTNAIVTVDTMNVEAELSEATGHDYYVTTSNVGDDTDTVTFDSVSGLALADIIKFENKTQGWVYVTAGATVTDTTIVLDLTKQTTGYPVPASTDEFEIVYRGTSRLTDGTAISKAYGIYNATEPSLTDGDQSQLQLNDKGQLKVTGGASSVTAEYLSPTDFTATYTSNVTITLSGLPITVSDSSQIVYIKVIPSSGDAAIYVNGSDGTKITYSSNVLTIAGAGTPFASGDVYEVGLNAQRKSYDATTDTTKVTNQTPESSKYVQDSLVDTTNVAAATNYYPSSTGMSMDGFKDMSLSGKFIDADGTMTLSVEFTNDEDTTNADWIDGSLTGIDVKTGINVIAGGLTVTDGTLTFGLEYDNINFSHVRIKMVNDGATNTAIIKMRRKAL